MSKKDKTSKITKNAVLFGRFIFIPLFAVAGWFLSGILLDVFFPQTINSELYQILIQSACALLAGVLAFALTKPLLAGLMAISELFERSLKNYTAKEILFGVFGMLAGGAVGLIIIWLGSMILSRFTGDNPANQIITIIVGIALVLIFGFIGMRVGAKIMPQAFPATNIAKSAGGGPVAETDIKILDSSSLIDGRILDIVRTGFLGGEIIIPDFILTELMKVADCDDILKKNRGRRGLDIAAALQKEKNIAVSIPDTSADGGDTDSRLIKLASEKQAKIITNDYNLNKLSSAQNVEVLNINDLANAIKPIALPGEKMTVKIVKKGKDYEQGVAYAADGTMIVVENGGAYIGNEVEVTVTTSLQTSAGRIIFTRIF